jgi:putative membrane protein
VGADTASSSSLLGGVARVYDIDEGTAKQLRDTLRARLRADIAARRAGRDNARTAEQGDASEQSSEA